MSDLRTPPQHREQYGVAVLTALFLVVGVAYLTSTLVAGRDFVAVVYPLLCSVVLLLLLVAEVASLVRNVRGGRVGDDQRARVTDEAPGQQTVAAASSTTVDDATAADTNTTDGEFRGTRWKTFLPFLLVTFAFAYVATQIDFLLGTALYMLVAAWLINRRRFSWKSGAVIAVVSAIAVYVLFVGVLHMSLPTFIPGL